MIIQAELRRKQSEYEGEACSVDKVWHDYRLPIVISYCCAIIMDTLYEKYHLCCI